MDEAKLMELIAAAINKQRVAQGLWTRAGDLEREARAVGDEEAAIEKQVAGMLKAAGLDKDFEKPLLFRGDDGWYVVTLRDENRIRIQKAAFALSPI